MIAAIPEGTIPTIEWWQRQYNSLLAYVDDQKNKSLFKFSRVFAMPDEDTFSIGPISDLLDRWLLDVGCIVDPFARNSTRGSVTNDLNPRTKAQYHLPAEEFLASYPRNRDTMAQVVLFDPPYSPRQISECYRLSKRKASMMDTQNARLCKIVKDHLNDILIPGGLAISCGWNSGGMGHERGFDIQEILLVNHGAAHNDTIVTVERKNRGSAGQSL